MDSIRCGACGRRRAGDDAVCLFCGRDPRSASLSASAAPSFAKRVLTAGGLALVASAVVAAPVLLAACGCGGCGAPGPAIDAGHGDAGPPTGDAGPQS
jgi:hypothetical protein